MSYAQALEDAKKRGIDSGTGWFGIKDGEKKKIRFVSDAIALQKLGQDYTKPGETPKPIAERLRVQYLVYVIDRQDGRIKPFGMPKTVFKKLVDWEQDEDFGWKTDLPPRDFTLSRSKDTGKVEYNLKPAKDEVALTDLEQQQVSEKEPIKILAEKQQLRANREIEAAKTQEHDFDPNDPGPQELEADELPTIQQGDDDVEDVPPATEIPEDQLDVSDIPF